jgi:photosystem II stability/assembly factor-like uncharacterized protein
MTIRKMALSFVGIALLGSMFSARAQQSDSDEEGQLRFRFVGPRVGNRIAAVAGLPGDASTYYAGAASGGVWKSIDGGNHWSPVFDKQTAAAIGALAVAPSDPSTVWAGSGEAWVIRDSDVTGNGIYKSTDAGKTWTFMGLPESGRIGRIVIHPSNPDIVFACVLGRTTGPQPDRGVFRTTDGGHNWERVLFAGENVGCSGLSMDPHNPHTLFAGMWQVEMHPWGEFSGGPGSGIYVSRDGGTKWTRIEEHGLPHSPLGKIDVAVAPTNSNRVFALIQTKDQGSLWRSDDAGEHWKAVNYQRALIGRAGYYIRLAISPDSDNEVLVANSSFWQSLDGGENFKEVPWGGDTHDIWFDPTNADRFAIADDGGLNITTVHGRGFHRATMPIGQMYHVDVDNQIPYYFYSNMQDDGNMRGPSLPVDSRETGWDHGMGGCESGFTVPDLADPNIVWATCYGNKVTRWDARSKHARSVSPWMHTLDSPPNEIKYRCHWTAPLAVDPFDHNTVYYGCQVIFKTTNGGQSWSVISPDLSTQDPSRIVPSGGIVGDNLGQFYGEVVFSIAPSKIQKGLIWAGTNDGQVWHTKDGGVNWINVTKNIAGVPPWGAITSIAPSTFNAATAYITVDLHLMDNRDPFIYKTTDFGKTWKQISGNFPKHALSYVRTIAEDPNCEGLLFAGTGNDLYYSLDDGGHWTALDKGLPHAPVTWAVVQKDFHDLVISTYGRGLYILDDISPLEQMAQMEKKHSDAAITLFEPRQTYRFTKGGQAMLTFSLKSATKGPVQLEILDAEGKVIRKLEAKGREGMNRVPWDLRYESPRVIALRTTAPDNPHIWDEPRFRDSDSRSITHWGTKGAEAGPIVAPGKYTVRLKIADQSYTQPLTILRDPRAPGSDADIELSVKTLLRIREDIERVSDKVNQIEWLRKQVEVIEAMLRPPRKKHEEKPAIGEDDDDEGTDAAAAAPQELNEAQAKRKADLLKATEDLDKKLLAIESKLVSPALLNSDDKYFVESYKVYLNLIWLNAEIGTGGADVAGGADFAPTDTQLNLLQTFEGEISGVDADYQTVMKEDLAALNHSLSESNYAALVASPNSAPAKQE